MQKISLPEAPPVQQAELRGNQPIHAKGGSENTSPSDKKHSQDQPPLAHSPAPTAPRNNWRDEPESIGMADCEATTPLRENSVKQNKPSNAGPDFLNSSGAPKPSKAPSGGMGWVVLLVICVIAVLWIAFKDTPDPNANQAAPRSPTSTPQTSTATHEDNHSSQTGNDLTPNPSSTPPNQSAPRIAESTREEPAKPSNRPANSEASSQPSTLMPKTPQLRIGKVINVSQGGSLTLRSSAGAQSKKIALIPYDSQEIEVLGDRTIADSDVWLAVVWKGLRGWVNGSYIAFSDSALELPSNGSRPETSVVTSQPAPPNEIRVITDLRGRKFKVSPENYQRLIVMKQAAKHEQERPRTANPALEDELQRLKKEEEALDKAIRRHPGENRGRIQSFYQHRDDYLRRRTEYYAPFDPDSSPFQIELMRVGTSIQ